MTVRDRLWRAFLRYTLNALLNLLVLVGVLRRLTGVRPKPRYQFHLEKVPRPSDPVPHLEEQVRRSWSRRRGAW